MLAQILHDLYVPRELLDELPEDQKQLLFCKMREEQVRRYHQREEEETMERDIFGTKSKKKKQVTFRLGADGNEWCWVMDESPDEDLNKKYLIITFNIIINEIFRIELITKIWKSIIKPNRNS
jgi:hypothetical protein